MPTEIDELLSDRVPVEANVEFNIEDFEYPGTHGMDRDFTVSVNAPVQWEFLGNVVSDFHATVLEEIVGATERIIERARAAKGPPPLYRVVPIERDTIYAPWSDAVSQVTLLGVDAGEAEFPLTRALYEHFVNVGMQPVRLDTFESYEEFRSAPEMADEAMVGMIGHLGDMSRLGHDAKEVPLSLPPWAEGKYRCWLEGDSVCCSIMVPGPDGQVRICTTWMPATKHLDEVVGHAHAVGAKDVTQLLGVLPTIACMMGGGDMAPRLAAVAPALLARPEVVGGGTFAGAMVPANHPSLAALMALLQHAQAGDDQAQIEWQKFEALAHLSDDLADSMKEAEKRLAKARKG